MDNISYKDKIEYKDMDLIKMQGNNSHHKSFFINEHIFEATQNKLHRHEYMQVNYVADGNGYCEFEDGVARFTQGSCFIVPPYVPHKIILADNVSSVKIFEVEFLMDFLFPPSHDISDMAAYSDFISLGASDTSAKEYSKHIITLNGDVREKVERIVADAFEEYTNLQPGFETVFRSLVLQLLTILGRAYNNADAEKPSDRYKKHRCEILKSIDYIHQNYSKDITLSELSKLVNYSNSYFSSLFKSVTDKSYLEYLNHYRIKKSIELLKNTDMQVIEIASSVGFDNVTNFNRMFKKLMGMSPTEYRKLT